MNSIEEIEQLAYQRLAEAKILCKEGMYNAAFYFSGYSIELMFKAKICAHFSVPNLFQSRESGLSADKEVRELANFCRTHDLRKLLLLSGLKKLYLDEKASNLILEYGLGAFIAQWSVEIRYVLEPLITQRAVETVLDYMEDEANGILQWIKNR